MNPSFIPHCAPTFFRRANFTGATSIFSRCWRGAIRLALFAAASAFALRAGAQTFYLLTEDGKLATVSAAAAGAPSTPVAISGVTAGETLVAVDVRPQNQQLYALGVNATANTATLYHISPETAVANVVGTAGSIAFVNATAVPVDYPVTNWDIDFNPAVDRLRVVSESGLNFRVNPNTGAPVDGDIGGAAGSVAGINTDGPINGGTTTAGAAAYTNNQPNNGSITTLYTLDAATNSLFIQNPPNVGAQTLGQTVTLRGNPLDFSQASFDIAPGVNATVSNGAVTSGFGYFVAKVGGATSLLYSVNLVNAQATLLGDLGLAVLSSAIRTEIGAAIVLNDTATILLRFNPATPGTTTAQAIASLTSGETLVGIDGRPTTGQLYGLGVNAAANTGTLYLLDPQTGAATVVGTAGGIAFVDAAAAPVDLPAAAVGYGLDFNPTVDRVRVVTGNGLNFRLNPITGAPVDGDLGGAAGSVAGINPDGALNGGTSTAQGAAYTNNFGGATATTLYTLDAITGKLFIQNPPNAGTQTLAVTLTRNGGAFSFAALNGFDIAANIAVATSNTAATGEGWIGVFSGTGTELCRMDLATGVVTAVGNIGTGIAPVTGLVLYAARPEIAVESPAGTVLTDNVGSVNFGTPSIGQAVTRSFIVKNRGTTPLSYTANLNGSLNGAYAITQNPSGSIPGSGSATIVVTLTPTAGGPVTDALHIASNDTAIASFDVPLTAGSAFTLGDDAATTTIGETRIYPLANDTLSGSLTITAVSNSAIVISGRALVIPAGFTGTFTYDVSNGVDTGRATVTVTAGTPVVNPIGFNGLLTDSNGDIAGWAATAITRGVATVVVRGGTSVVRTTAVFPTNSTTATRFTELGNLTLVRNADGSVNLTLAALGGNIGGRLRPHRTSATPGVHFIALASIDAAIPGGGYAIARVTAQGGVTLGGRLPDGLLFTAGTVLRDNGTIAFFNSIGGAANPPGLIGGELLTANLATTDITGEIGWSKLPQLPTASGTHRGGLETILTANGNLFTGVPSFSGAGTLTLSGGNLAGPEISPNTVTAGFPTVPAGSLKAWARPEAGVFTARVLVPGVAQPVVGVGLYLTKSKRAWGYFPGTTVGGRIELKVP